MTFDEFTDSVLRGLEEKAPEYSYELRDDLADSDGSLHTGIFVVRDENSLVMGINLEDKYAGMTDGNGSTGIDDMVSSLIEGIRCSFEAAPSLDDFMSQYVSDYDDAKEHLVMNMLRVSGNEDLLKQMPHGILGDMAVVYSVQAWFNGTAFDEVPITNDEMANFNISAKQLDQDAKISAPRERKPVLCEWRDVVSKRSGEQVTPIMDQEGNEIRVLYGTTVVDEDDEEALFGMFGGAAVMLYPGYLDSVAEMAGGDFYILPFSVDFVLFVPKSDTPDLSTVGGLAASLHAAEMLPENRLSDLMLVYNSAEHRLDEEAYKIG